MKKFSLACEHDREFEGWFADADAIRQQSAGLLDCPYCGSTNLENGYQLQTCLPKTKARITDHQRDVPPPAAELKSAPEASAAKDPSAALHPQLGKVQRPCGWRCGPCVGKFRLNLQMSAIDLQKKPVKFKRHIGRAEYLWHLYSRRTA